MKPLSDQFASLCAASPGACMQANAGLNLVTLPNMPLPSGWSKGTANVKFVVPNGYPYAPPDCFWTDSDLRLSNGAMPQNCQVGNVMPGQPDPNTLWFSWHVSSWNAATCNLITYVAVIRRRFEARI